MTSVLSPRCERLVGLLACAAGVSCGSAEPAAPGGPPSYTLLSETGLYADPGSLVLSSEAQAFTPAFALWSDGADKSRWVALPPGNTIDTSDMNRWLLPIGTRFWKEFSLGGVRLETRLIERFGPEPGDYFMGSFVWNEDQSDAVFTEAGQDNLLGTEHDAPAQERCPACHNGEPGRSLGFSALQLGAALDSEASSEAVPESGVSLASLAAEGRLSAAPPDPLPQPPGDGVAAQALGYLHANCGHCHNPRGTAWPDTQMLLRLGIDDVTVEGSGLYQSVVGQRLQYFRDQGGDVTLRVDPGRPETSGLVARMAVRGPMEQMPPLATEQVDAAGLELIRGWIAELTPTP